MDETSVSVGGRWNYLYRAVDRHGKSVYSKNYPLIYPLSSACLNASLLRNVAGNKQTSAAVRCRSSERVLQALAPRQSMRASRSSQPGRQTSELAPAVVPSICQILPNFVDSRPWAR
jgi:hypothetical protein